MFQTTNQITSERLLFKSSVFVHFGARSIGHDSLTTTPIKYCFNETLHPNIQYPLKKPLSFMLELSNVTDIFLYYKQDGIT